MNIKDLVGPLLLATGLVLLGRSAIQYFGGDQRDTGGFVAPRSKEEQEPLRLEVDFLDNENQIEEKLIPVKTDFGTYTFSNHGGCVKTLDFLREQDGKKLIFNTIGSHSHSERETRAFLIALDENTPYYYKVKEDRSEDSKHYITYQSETDAAIIEKSFIVHDTIHRMDMTIKVTPKAGKEVRPRLIFPSPYLQVLGKTDFVNAFVIDRSGLFSKRSQAKVDERAGYFTPQIFGTEDKYFIHSLIEDTTQFARRAYYKVIGQQTSSFLEAPAVNKETTWSIAFYMGPKTGPAINPVAPLLDQTLDYGFLSPLTKGALYFLNFVNKYVGNYGWAIIIVTFLIKLILLPFTFSGHKKMEKLQEYSQKVSYLQQKYKHNPEMLAQAKEELIRTHGMPGIGGCLPVLFQMPMFWILNAALNNSIELYRSPFIFWIKDLSLADPYYVLPAVSAFSVFLGMTSSGKKMTAKQIMGFLAVALFIFGITSSMSAGVALFFVTNGILHFGQMKLQKVLG
jgi:YidC/Oxa1 family membrane protein insertase